MKNGIISERDWEKTQINKPIVGDFLLAIFIFPSDVLGLRW